MTILNIWGKRTLEHIPDVLAHLNRGVDPLVVRAIAGNASKGLEIAYALNQEFGIQVAGIEMKPFEFDGVQALSIEITLKAPEGREPAVRDYDLPESGFVDFPAYHLLLDWWLFQKRELQLLDNGTHLATISQDGKVAYDGRNEGVRAALYRCGYLWPSNWKEIATRLSEFDDVILGMDTNVLYNCTLNEHLLPALSLVNPRSYAPTPNWMLLVIPSSVMHELEEAANIRNPVGFLEKNGRMGFRALQEVIELNQSEDVAGISLLVVGQADPALDTRVELQGLRADLRRSQQSHGGDVHWSRKSSSGDMIIRSQFRDFLRQIDFHKGAYFLTADKSNAALARAEGLAPIYIQPPSGAPHEITASRVPIGKLVYEMAVQFRPLTVMQGSAKVELRCDGKGEKIDYWVCRNLEMEEQGFKRLRSDYGGKFSLGKVTETWHRIGEEILAVDR